MDDNRHEDPRPADLRASDAEREQVVELLNRHAGEGRLTLEELSQRIEQAYNAKTRAELEPLTADLPTEPNAARTPVSRPSRRKPVSWDVAIMGGNERKGRFRIRERLTAIAIMGGSDIDLRNAEIEGDEVTINVIAIMGGSNIYVPDTVEVELGGIGLMGGNVQRGSSRPTHPGAPVVRVNAYSLMGGSEIWRLPAETRGMSLKQAKKAAQRMEKGQDPLAITD